MRNKSNPIPFSLNIGHFQQNVYAAKYCSKAGMNSTYSTYEDEQISLNKESDRNTKGPSPRFSLISLTIPGNPQGLSN